MFKQIARLRRRFRGYAVSKQVREFAGDEIADMIERDLEQSGQKWLDYERECNESGTSSTSPENPSVQRETTPEEEAALRDFFTTNRDGTYPPR